MKSKVMGVDAANRRKNKAFGVSGKASGGVGATTSASLGEPRRFAKAEIKDYLSKVAREDRETEKSNYKTLDRAMGGADAKATKQDLKAARQDRMSKSSAPSKSPRPMRSPVKKAGGGMIGYKDGGCVMAGRGGNFRGEM